jgi:hypothetical protein
MYRRGDLVGLKRALRYQDIAMGEGDRPFDYGVPTRRAAAYALGSFYGEEVALALTAALGDPDEEVKLAAVDSLVSVSGREATAPLVVALAEWELPRYERAAEAVDQALASLGGLDVPEQYALACAALPGGVDPARHRPFLDSLLDRDPRDTREASRSVSAELLRTPSPRGSAAWTVLSWLAPMSVSVLMGALTAPHSQLTAIELLGEARDNQAYEPLAALLVHRDPLVRAACARALGAIRDTRAVPSLTALTRDPVFEVRAAAGEALEAFGAAGISASITVALDALRRELTSGEVLEPDAGGTLLSRMLGSPGGGRTR